MSNLYTNELRRRPTVCPAASEAAVLLKKKGLVKKKGLDFDMNPES